MEVNIDKRAWMPKAVAVLGALLVLAVGGEMAWGWGEGGHKAVARQSALLVPKPLRTLLHPYLEALQEAAVDPDRRKSEPGVADEGKRHFIDLDALEPYPFEAFPHALAEAETKYGKLHLHNQGIVPWAIAESYHNLVIAWQEGDPNWLRWWGDLAHYVADIHQPFHTTANFDGQKTGNRGIHALFEAVMFDGFWKDRYFKPTEAQSGLWWAAGGGVMGALAGFTVAGPVGALAGAAVGAVTGYAVNAALPKPPMAPVEDPLEEAFAIITDSYTQLEPLLEAHNQAKAYRQTNPKFYQTFWEQGAKQVMIAQIKKAAYALARYTWSAWLEAGRPKF